LLLQTAIENNITIIHLLNHYTYTSQPLDKCFYFGPSKSYFKNKATACKVTQYHLTRLTGFVGCKVASVSVGVNAFESKGIYPFNHHRVSEYLFSISVTSETITSMETAPPSMALLCVPSTSVTNSQTVLPTPAEPSLCTQSTSF
jgi:hypothetical protein